MSTGEAIGIMAKEQGLNLRQLALKADVPYNTLYAIVKRKSSRIDGRTLCNIADALGVSIDDLESFTPQIIHLDASDGWAVGPLFRNVVTTLMIDAKTREERNAARDDAIRLFYFFDRLNGEGQKKAIELLQMLTGIPSYRNSNAGEQRQVPPQVKRRVQKERAKEQVAKNEAALYKLLDDFLAEYDAGKTSAEKLAVAFANGDESKVEPYSSLLNQVIEAHSANDEEELHKAMADFVDLLERTAAKSVQPGPNE